MLHTERLELCGVCGNRGFSSKQGVICQLTDDRPTFEDDCVNFSEDFNAIAGLIREEEDRIGKQPQVSERTARIMHGVNFVAVFGAIMVTVSLLWLLIGIFQMNRIYFYPIGLFVFGMFVIFVGILNRRKEREQKDLLDEEL